MFVNSLDNKPLYTRPDGIELRDLTQSIFQLKSNSYVEFDAYKVPKEYVMRADLISKAVYNDSKYTELILKYNGISNPYTINEGDIILIPNLDSAQEKIKNVITSSAADQAEELRKSYKYLDPTKKPTKGEETKNFDNRNLNDTSGDETKNFDNRNLNDTSGDETSNGITNGSLPPNLADANTSQITYRDGRVYFGEGTETCLHSGISQGEFLTSVIKNKNK